MTTVVNKSRHIPAPGDVYIGRPTKWSNPFPIVEGINTRAQAIQRYEDWIKSKPQLIADAKRELKGKTLVCWCKPYPCHGDILARIAEEP